MMDRRGDGVPIIREETKKLTGKFPEYRLIDDSELHLIIPAAELDKIWCDGRVWFLNGIVIRKMICAYIELI